MSAIYKVTYETEDGKTVSLELSNQKNAIAVRDQLKKAGFEAKAELSKTIE